MNFVYIFGGKLIFWELAEGILSLKRPTKFIEENCVSVELEVRIGMRVAKNREETKRASWTFLVI